MSDEEVVREKYPDAYENRWRDGDNDGYSIVDPVTDKHLGTSEHSFKGAWKHAASKIPQSAPREDKDEDQELLPPLELLELMSSWLEDDLRIHYAEPAIRRLRELESKT